MVFELSKQLRTLRIVAFIGILLSPFSLHANPAGEIVQFGEVQFDRSGGTLRIIQGSQRAIIDWEAFSIAQGETTQFSQTGSDAAVLNRVRGRMISRIDGSLQANGNVFLLNPNGIVVGPTGMIDVGGFVGSTLDISNEEFLAGGDLQFRGSSRASVINLGSISATDGDVFLMAATVDNSGFIRAPRGTVGLAAGNEVFLKESGEERVFVRGAEGTVKEDGVVNTGVVEANTAELKSFGGNIYGMAVRNEGRVAATGITESGGQIFLSASGGKIQSGGQLIAKRPTERKGGRVKVDSGEGGRVGISGTIDVSGESGGSIVLLGDDIDVFDGALILADGTVSDGGEILIVAEKLLTFQGWASARGGAAGGEGGFVELSGKESIQLGRLDESVDVSSAGGKGGTLFIDPNDIEVVEGSPPSTLDEIGGSPTSKDTLYEEDVISFLGTGNLIIQTNSSSDTGNGDIFIRNGVDLSFNSEFDLTIRADRNFVMEAGSNFSNSGSGGFSVTAGNSIRIGAVVTGVTTGISTGTGAITFSNQKIGQGGISIVQSVIETVDGEINILSRNDSDIRLSITDNSRIEATGAGNITLTGTGPLYFDFAPPPVVGTGILVDASQLRTISGDISLQGIGAGDETFAGLRIANGSQMSSQSGDLSLQGISQNTGGSNGIEIVGDSMISANEEIHLNGLSGGGNAIFIEEQTISTNSTIFGDGTQNIRLETRLGNVSVTDIEADELKLIGRTGIVDDFSVFDSRINSVDGVSGRDVTIETSGSIILGDILAGGSIFIGSNGDFDVMGSLEAQTRIELMGPAVDGTLYTFRAGSSATAPEVVITNGIYNPPSPSTSFSAIPFSAAAVVVPGAPLGRIEAHGEFDITNFIFNNIEEVEGVGSMASLVTDAGGQEFSIVQYNRDTSDSGPDFRTAALIDGLHFYDFETITGGASADTISIDLPDGQSFDGTLSGGGGDDKILILSDGAGIQGTLLGGDGFDTLSYEQFDEGVVVDLGSASSTGIESIEGFEGIIGSRHNDQLIGTDGSDSFRITGADRGNINKGSFQSFEELSGGGGDDRFEFFNQATVASVAGGGGADMLFIDDSSLGGTNTYRISENQISRNPTYHFNGIEVVQINFGPGDDTVVTGSRGFVQILDGGAGNDTLSMPGGQALGSSPIILGGNPIVHSNFENPSSSNGQTQTQGPDSGNVLTQQVGNDQGDTPGPDDQGGVTNNFNSADGPDENMGLFQSNLFVSQGGTFSAAIVGQAAVLTLDGGDYAYDKPASLDGEFLNADYSTILRLRGNLDFAAIAELSGAIGYGGPVIMIMEDGGYAIDLGGVPPAQVLAGLVENLDRNAAAELLAALEMTIAIPITSEDGAVSILTVPIQANPAILANLADQIGPESQAELAAALDGA